MSRQTRENPRELRWTTCLPIVLVAVGVVVYLDSFAGVFILDDQRNILDNRWIRRLWPIWDVLAHSRRPVVSLSLAINHAISRFDVWSYHAWNLTVHVAAAVTLFGVTRRTLTRGPLAETHGSSAPWLAMAIALIWLVHPLQTQSVTYIIQRGESMMGLFCLLTLYCVIRGADARRAWPWHLAAVVACALGMGSKAVMVGAPLLVLLYDRAFLATSLRDLFRRRWALYIGLAATWVMLITSGVARGVLFAPADARTTVGFGFKGVTPLEYALTQPGVILHYLRLSVWPDPPCLDYEWPIARTATAIVPTLLAVAALLIATLWALRRRPRLGFLGAAFFIVLAPTSSIIPIRDIAFEHRMYLPLASVITLLVLGGHEIAERLLARMRTAGSAWSWTVRVARVGLVVAIAAALSAQTIRRNRQYHDPEGMWRDVLRTSPQNSRAHNNLGNALQAEGKLDEAIAHFRKALRLKPGQAEVHNNLGSALASQNKLDEAIRCYRQALDLAPRYAEAHCNLGAAHQSQGQWPQAAAHYRDALRYNPHMAQAHCNLASILAFQGNLDEAITHSRRALEIDPDSPEAHYNLALALAMTSRPTEALTHFQVTLRFRPDWLTALNATAWFRATYPDPAIREPNEAIRLAERAAQLTGNRDPGVLDTLAAAYAAGGRFGDAVATARTALDLAAAGQNLDLATAIRGRITLYQRKEPYLEPQAP